jgi:DnaK suppressor protein
LPLPRKEEDPVDTLMARRRLEEMRGEIDRSIGVLRGEQPAGRGGSDSPQDPADAGSNLSETDRVEAILAAAQSQRRLVMDALVRIEHGSYGMCADCASPIPEGRLDARPEAARCVGCQSKRDRRH